MISFFVFLLSMFRVSLYRSFFLNTSKNRIQDGKTPIPPWRKQNPKINDIGPNQSLLSKWQWPKKIKTKAKKLTLLVRSGIYDVLNLGLAIRIWSFLKRNRHPESESCQCPPHVLMTSGFSRNEEKIPGYYGHSYKPFSYRIFPKHLCHDWRGITRQCGSGYNAGKQAVSFHPLWLFMRCR